jgi:hypothetical protein
MAEYQAAIASVKAALEHGAEKIEPAWIASLW